MRDAQQVTGEFNGAGALLFRYGAATTPLKSGQGETSMTQDQGRVAIGAASGIVAMVLLVWGLSAAIGAPGIPDSAADRLAYALRWAVLPALTLFAMIAAVGNQRFFSEAIDPTRGKESEEMIVNGRVADNTTQQFLLFLVGILALSVSLPIARMGIIAAIAITFVIVRIAFWIGYRIKPVYRAFGFASTAYLNLGMLIAALWLWLG